MGVETCYSVEDENQGEIQTYNRQYNDSILKTNKGNFMPQSMQLKDINKLDLILRGKKESTSPVTQTRTVSNQLEQSAVFTNNINIQRVEAKFGDSYINTITEGKKDDEDDYEISYS